MIEPINHGEEATPIRMRADVLKVLILIKRVIRLLQSGTMTATKLSAIKALLKDLMTVIGALGIAELPDVKQALEALQVAFKRAGLGDLDISSGGGSELALDKIIRKLTLLLDRVRELDSPDLQLSVVDPLVFDPTVTKSIMVELSSQMTGPVVESAVGVPATYNYDS